MPRTEQVTNLQCLPLPFFQPEKPRSRDRDQRGTGGDACS
ncbi:hypothetical protein Celaphus_00001259 [Cervus elaphus hippelaphus]|uniref:Uncharacterized protein n=1 Tax=Cervus elaphus hippelaphus TaxID=46360 RepID=A0A212D938_CEREH|nr:hypothetical protein Celaphus_00001259 [Cervus elaphus hippelaphus]